MPDAPDWHPYQPGSSRYVLKDMGELAARLGSPVVYDRLGEVVFMDDFRYGLAPYYTSLDGTGASVKVSAANTLLGGFGMRLTGGSDSGRTGSLLKFLSNAEISQWGIECGVSLPGNFDYFHLELSFYDGVERVLCVLRLDKTNNEIQLQEDGTVNTKVDDLTDPVQANGMFHNLKIVANFETGYYTRLRYNYTDYNVSDLYMNRVSVPVAPGSQITAKMGSRSGQNDYCDLARIIVTANEP